MDEPDRRSRFEATFLPHLPAAYNLARWLTRDGHDAENNLNPQQEAEALVVIRGLLQRARAGEKQR